MCARNAIVLRQLPWLLQHRSHYLHIIRRANDRRVAHTSAHFKCQPAGGAEAPLRFPLLSMATMPIVSWLFLSTSTFIFGWYSDLISHSFIFSAQILISSRVNPFSNAKLLSTFTHRHNMRRFHHHARYRNRIFIFSRKATAAIIIFVHNAGIQRGMSFVVGLAGGDLPISCADRFHLNSGFNGIEGLVHYYLE